MLGYFVQGCLAREKDARCSVKIALHARSRAVDFIISLNLHLKIAQVLVTKYE